jgi:hypothetical protein
VTVTHNYQADVFDAPDRLFQIRQAARTHAQVWLQADRPSESEHRLEVLFPAVQYLCLPFAFRGLHLRRAPAGEAARLLGLHGVTAEPERDVYLLSREHDWFVVSAKPTWAESALSYNEPTVFFNPDYGPDVVVSVGTLT